MTSYLKQKSLSLYIKRYAGKNAKTEDLWCVLSEESGLQINSMMDDWTKKNGYPVISVKSKDDILEFEQVLLLINKQKCMHSKIRSHKFHLYYFGDLIHF